MLRKGQRGRRRVASHAYGCCVSYISRVLAQVRVLLSHRRPCPPTNLRTDSTAPSPQTEATRTPSIPKAADSPSWPGLSSARVPAADPASTGQGLFRSDAECQLERIALCSMRWCVKGADIEADRACHINDLGTGPEVGVCRQGTRRIVDTARRSHWKAQ